jgi:hypothetical protein
MNCLNCSTPLVPSEVVEVDSDPFFNMTMLDCDLASDISHFLTVEPEAPQACPKCLATSVMQIYEFVTPTCNWNEDRFNDLIETHRECLSNC